MPHVVFAEIRVKSEHFSEARDAVRGILADTRAEHGCEMFGLHEAADGSPRLFIYER